MRRMDQTIDLRQRVVAALREREGELRKISKAVGIPYDTVLRIKNEEGDPGYSKVQALAEHLLAPAVPTEAEPAQAGA